MGNFDSKVILKKNKNSSVYLLEEKGKQYLTKKLHNDLPDKTEEVLFYNEYNLLKQLENHPEFAHFGLRKALDKFTVEGNLAYSLAYINGASLADLTKKGFTLLEKEITNLGISLTRTLQFIHQNGVLHLDLNPHNILLDNVNQFYYIIDFSSSSKKKYTPLERENFNQKINYYYSSPEASGRLNRIVDERSDLYSMGIILYELISGVKPISGDDPMSVIYNQINTVPANLRDIGADCNINLANIIQKLLRKNPEDRYQTAYGLIYDLQKALEERTEFTLGKEDVITEFQFNSKLYGRQNDLAFMDDKIHEVKNGEFQIVLVNGKKGYGKTAFGNEIKALTSAHRGIFLSVTQIQENIVFNEFNVLSRIFKSLIRYIMDLNHDGVQKWNKIIFDSLTENEISFLTTLSTDFKEFVNSNDSYITIPNSDSSIKQEQTEKVYLTLLKLFRGISSNFSPLVIFIDDLHLVNYSTINFLSLLLTEINLKNILIAGTYSDNGLPGSHPIFSLTQSKFQQHNNVSFLDLEPINKQDIESVLSDGVKVNIHNDLSKLAQIIWDKTSGIPLYVNHFVKMLVKESIINYNTNLREWEFNLNAAKELNFDFYTEGSFDFNIHKLSPVHKEVLFLASCVGNKFNIDKLQKIGPWDFNHLESILESLVLQHFIFSLGNGKFIFIHDRIRKIAYNLKNNKDRSKIHRLLGKQYHEKYELLQKVEHLNKVVENDEQSSLLNTKLVELNIEAAEILFKNTSYDVANEYLNRIKKLEEALNFLPSELVLRIFNLKIKLKYELKKNDSSYELCKKLINMDYPNKDKKTAINYLVLNSSNIGNQEETMRLLMDLLKQENYYFSTQNVSKTNILKELVNIKARVILKGKKSLEDLPALQNEKYDFIVFILTLLTSLTFFNRTSVYPLIILKLLSITLKHGLNIGSAYSLAVLSLYYSEVLGDRKRALYLNNVSKSWLLKTNDPSIVPKYNVVYLTGLASLEKNYHEIEALYKESFESSWNKKDKVYTTLSLALRTSVRVFFTQKLSVFPKDKEALLQILQNAYHEPSKNMIDVLDRAYTALSDTNYYNQVKNKFNSNLELKGQESIQGIKNHPVYYMFTRLFVSVILRKNESTTDLFRLIEGYAESGVQGYLTIKDQFHFYKSLALLRDMQGKPFLQERKSYIKHTKQYLSNLKCLQNITGNNINHNYRIKALEATLSMVYGDVKKTCLLLKEAIEEAALIKYPLEEAILEEELTRIYLLQKDDKLGLYHLKQTIKKFHQWGAYNKVKSLEEEFTELLELDNHNNQHSSSYIPYNHIDFISVIKSIQIISGETEINALVEKILNLSIQNSGADKGILFLSLNKKWKYFAGINISKGNPNFKMVYKDIEKVENYFPSSTFNMVKNTRKAFFFGDGVSIDTKKNDVYYQRTDPKSVLCIPLILQNELRGVLYLENKNVKNLFTEERINVLQMIGTQAIISLQNALLVDDLKKEHDKRIMAQKERFNLEKQLFQSKKMETLGTLAGGISHDFRNLLNPIQGFAELALENVETGKNPEAIDDIKRVLKGTQRATELVSQIATISRKTETEHELFNLTKLIDETIPFVRATIPKNIKIKTVTIGNESLFIKGSSTQIQQVLLNIFTNAYHAINKPNGSINFEFEHVKELHKYEFIHGLNRNTEWVKIEIADNGKGMSEEIKSKIFDPFFTTKKVGKGTGLGLAVTHGIITTHKGIIHVESEVDKGTTFYIFLPVSKIKKAENDNNIPVSIDGSGKKVILVDDEDMSLLLLEKMLSKLKFETETFESSTEAYNYILANKEDVDLIVTDQNMPEITGVELAKNLISENIDIPIILNTGDTSYSTNNNSLPKNIKSTIAKPITLDQLSQRINECFKKVLAENGVN